VLLRESLDREKITNDQLNAALDHVHSLEGQLSDAKISASVDASRVVNLKAQLDAAQGEVKEARAALDSERAATAKLQANLDNAEKEVAKQKAKVAAANRHLLWGILGGVIVGALAAIAVGK
jgi:capsule polysaccharide export protein KpsE/RkpR